MAQIPNSIGVAGPIAPYDTTDTYPTHFAKYGKGGYFTVQTFSELSNTPPARLESGSLAYVSDEEVFYLYRNNEWEPIDLLEGVDTPIEQIEPIKPEDLPQYLQSVDRGSKYIIYVDPNHSNATDEKTNKGNSPLRPFKTIERACIEAARKSFKVDGNVNTPNDFSEKVTIYLAPATYYVNNGKGGVAYDLEFNKRQDASQLILANKDWLITRAYAHAGIDAYIDTVPGTTVNERNELKIACKRDLNIYISDIASDIAKAGNYSVTLSANTIKPGGTFIGAYNQVDERTKTVTALTKIRDDIQAYVIKNTADTVGGVTIPGITEDANAVNPCSAISTEVAVLVEIITSTLNAAESILPPSLENASEGLYSMAFPETGEPTDNNLQSFNSSSSAGIILPRGISIIGADLRKVVIRPKYVPKKDGTQGKSAIFRMTGGNFFSGFTVRDHVDALEIGSHHNLSCFEFCSLADLQLYYNNIANVFKDNKDYNLLFDASNLLFYNTSWINSKIEAISASTSEQVDYKTDFVKYTRLLVSSISADLRDQTSNKFKYVVSRFKAAYVDTIDDVSENLEARTAYKEYFESLYDYMVEAISNRANIAEGGYIDANVPEDKTNPTNPCQDVQAIIYNFYQLFGAIIDGVAEISPYPLNNQFTGEDVEATIGENQIVGVLGTDTVESASPYVFSASLRSEWGMCGINGDGGIVAGFRSYLVAQFTIISLQRDNDAFVTTGDLAEKEVGNKRYAGSSLGDSLEGIEDYRHYGYRVSRGAYAQLVSCFCIGPAINYITESGGELSITNSTSNFGDVSLYSFGFNDYIDAKPELGNGAYTQDKDHSIIAYITPKSVNFDDEGDIQNFSLGVVESYQYTTTELTEGTASGHNGWLEPDAYWLNWTNTYLKPSTDSYYRVTKTVKEIVDDEGGIVGYQTIVGDRVYLQGYSFQTGEVLSRNVDYPLKIVFEGIKAVKIRISGRLTNLPPSVRIKEDGTPDLKYIYAPNVEEIAEVIDTNSGPLRVNTITGNSGPYTSDVYNANAAGEYDEIYQYAERGDIRVSSLEIPNKILVSKWRDANGNFNNTYSNDSSYNSTIYQKRRAKVLAVIEDPAGAYTDIVIDLRDGLSQTGEWFERTTVYGVSSSNGQFSTARTSLIGNRIDIKRFVDRRTSDERKYRLLFKKANQNKRIPPDNFILRKGGNISSAQQPFKWIPGSTNTIYSISNTQQITDDFLENLGGSYNNLAALGAQVGEESYYFMTEIYSANSDKEGRALTQDDTTLTDKFYFVEDAEVLLSKPTSDPERINAVNIPGFYPGINQTELDTKVYQSAIQLRGSSNESVLNLLGISVSDTSFKVKTNGLEERIYTLNPPPTVDFCKPSTIRASGHTWEYCGYFNYSTGVPALQNENLGDRVNAGFKRQFRFEKIQRSILGGRIYSTGMDELGNVIQGNTILDLKKGESETIVLGTTPEVTRLNTDSESNPELRIPQSFNSLEVNQITVNNALTAGQASYVDFSALDPRNFKYPGQGSDASSEIIFGDEKQESIKFRSKLLDLQEVTNIYTDTFRQEGTTLILGNSGTVEVNLNNLDAISGTTIGDNYTLAKRATDTEVRNETTNEKYVTPAQLKIWRREKKLLQAGSFDAYSVYITQQEIHTAADEDSNGNTLAGISNYAEYNDGKAEEDRIYHGQAISPAEIAVHNAILQDSEMFPEIVLGTIREVQFSNPNKPDFRSFKYTNDGDLKIIVDHLNTQYALTDTVTFYMDGGKYDISSVTFNFGVKINGVNNTGKIGRFDGTDIITGVSKREGLGTLPSVILYVRPRLSQYVSWTLETVYLRSWTCHFNGNSGNSLSRLHIWPSSIAVQDPNLGFGYKPSGNEIDSNGFYYKNTLDSFIMNALQDTASFPLVYTDNAYTERGKHFPRVEGIPYGAPFLYFSNTSSSRPVNEFIEVIFGGQGFCASRYSNTGTWVGSYIQIQSDCTLKLSGCSLRGNVVERLDCRWGIKNDTRLPGYSCATGQGAIRVPDHTGVDNLYPYGSNVTIGFSSAFISILSGISLNITLGISSSNNRTYRYKVEDGLVKVSLEATSSAGLVSVNNDRNNIRFEKNTGALTGLQDDRLQGNTVLLQQFNDTSDETSFRGTDILGEVDEDGITSLTNTVRSLLVSVDTIDGNNIDPIHSTAYENLITKIKDQGPLLKDFFAIRDSSCSIIIDNSYSIFNSWGITSNGYRICGFMGSCGIRYTSTIDSGQWVINPINRYDVAYGVNSPNFSFKSVSQYYSGLWVKAGYGTLGTSLSDVSGTSWKEIGILSTEYKAGLWSGANKKYVAYIQGAGSLMTTIDPSTDERWVSGGNSRVLTITRPIGSGPLITEDHKIGVLSSITNPVTGVVSKDYNLYNVDDSSTSVADLVTYSTNLTGSLVINTNGTVVGTSTEFLNELEVGSIIINAEGSELVEYRVTGVTTDLNATVTRVDGGDITTSASLSGVRVRYTHSSALSEGVERIDVVVGSPEIGGEVYDVATPYIIIGPEDSALKSMQSEGIYGYTPLTYANISTSFSL